MLHSKHIQPCCTQSMLKNAAPILHCLAFLGKRHWQTQGFPRCQPFSRHIAWHCIDTTPGRLNTRDMPFRHLACVPHLCLPDNVCPPRSCIQYSTQHFPHKHLQSAPRSCPPSTLCKKYLSDCSACFLCYCASRAPLVYKRPRGLEGGCPKILIF